MKATVADGMKIIEESKEASINLLVLDVDQKDPSLPLRCPPECFITCEALQQSKKSLSEDGIMGKIIQSVTVVVNPISSNQPGLSRWK